MIETILLTAALVVAQPQAPPIAIDLPKAKISKQAQMSDDYGFYRARAIEQGRPIVIFVGIDKRPVTGAVVVRVDRLDRYTEPCVVIGVPDARVGMAWKATLGTSATDADIRRAVSPPTLPFFKQLRDKREQRTADAEPHARQLPTWFPRNAIRYHHAERTQSLSTTNNQYNITSVPRTALERKWLFPGGLENVGGWQSDLYKSVEVEPYRAFLPALNSGGSYQLEAGWHRTYPDGTWFADVLSVDGEPFEIRVREKIDGAWDNYVAFRNPANYPSGYVPVQSNQCMGCHQQAGQARYNGAAIPGADTVISDPFPDLEEREGSRFFGPNRFFGQIASGFLAAREYRR